MTRTLEGVTCRYCATDAVAMDVKEEPSVYKVGAVCHAYDRNFGYSTALRGPPSTPWTRSTRKQSGSYRRRWTDARAREPGRAFRRFFLFLSWFTVHDAGIPPSGSIRSVASTGPVASGSSSPAAIGSPRHVWIPPLRGESLSVGLAAVGRLPRSPPGGFAHARSGDSTHD
jgi:hypothetical protein